MSEIDDNNIFLTPCIPNDVSGDEIINDPEIIYYKKSLVIPTMNASGGSPCGVFDEYCNLLIPASNINGKEKQLSHMNPEVFLRENIKFLKTVKSIYWGGCIIGHYGHFIMDVLPRWWAYKEYKKMGYKLGINIKGHTESEIFSMKWLQEFLIILGINNEDLHIFKCNTCVEDMIIAYPLLVDRNYYHKRISSFFSCIGREAELHVPEGKFTGDYYLSRKKLKSGTRQIINEDEIEQIMKKNGIEILYPEELSVFEQITIFRRGNIYGFLSSAFHNSAFSDNANGLCFSISREINRSYSLFDSASNSRIIYVNTPNIHVKKHHEFFLSVEIQSLNKLNHTINSYKKQTIEKSYSYCMDKKSYINSENGPFYLENHFKEIAYISNDGEKIDFYNKDQEKLLVYVYGDIAFFFLGETKKPKIFTIQKEKSENKYSFRDLDTDMYVSISDHNKGRILSCNRRNRRDWEKFSMKLGEYNKDGFIKIISNMNG